jgi:hypothetical protein
MVMAKQSWVTNSDTNFSMAVNFLDRLVLILASYDDILAI